MAFWGGEGGIRVGVLGVPYSSKHSGFRSHHIQVGVDGLGFRYSGRHRGYRVHHIEYEGVPEEALFLAASARDDEVALLSLEQHRVAPTRRRRLA